MPHPQGTSNFQFHNCSLLTPMPKSRCAANSLETQVALTSPEYSAQCSKTLRLQTALFVGTTVWGKLKFFSRRCIANISRASATSSSFLCYFRIHHNGKIHHNPLTKWFGHIYAYLWGSNPIKRGGIALLRTILIHNTKKEAAFLQNMQPLSLRAGKWHLADASGIMLMVVDFQTNCGTVG